MPLVIPPVWLAAADSDFSATTAVACSGFACVAVLSQYLGFFAWYHGMDLGGVARVSQGQVTQVFLTMFLSGWLPGEVITAQMIVFAVAVVATVAIGRRMPIARN